MEGSLRTVLFGLLLFLSLLLAGVARAQDRSRQVLDLYEHAQRLNDADDLQGLRAFTDSLADAAPRNSDVAALSDVLHAIVLRREGNSTAAFQALDAIPLDHVRNDYALHFAVTHQRARVMKDLMLFTEAWTEVERAIQLARAYGMRTQEARVLVLRSEVSIHLQHFDEGLQDLIHAEQMAEQLGLKDLVCTIEIDQGNLYYHQKRMKEALAHYERARDLAKERQLMAAYRTALFNVASTTFDQQRDAASAAAATSILDSMLEQFGHDPLLEADIHANVAFMRHFVGQHEAALQRLEKGLRVRKQLGDTNGLAWDSKYLSAILWDLGRKEDALDAVQQAIDLAARVGDMQLASDAEFMAHNYLKQLGRTERSLAHMEAYAAAKDSLIALQDHAHTANLEIQYGSAKKERALKQKEVALDAANTAKRRREVQLFWAIGAGLMLATVLLLLFRNNQHIKRLREKDRVVHAQAVNDLMHQQEIRSLDAMMEGQERERKRVAQDLHDRLGSMLSAIKLQFSALEGRIEEMRSDQVRQYHHVFTLLDDAVGEVRRISHDMVKSSLTRFGLKGALQDLHGTVHVPGKLEVEMSLFGLDDRLDQRVEIAVYRMVQECINNALRHARARHITVQVTRSAGMLNLIVEDDGVGFDPAHVNEGMGMGNLRRRAAEIGGTVRVDTLPGRGTSVSVDVPLPTTLTTSAT